MLVYFRFVRIAVYVVRHRLLYRYLTSGMFAANCRSSSRLMRRSNW